MAGINPILRVVTIIPPHILQEFNNDPSARQNFLFFTENPGHKLCELLNVFREYLNDETLYNSIVQHAQMSYECKLFFLDDNLDITTPEKWTLLLKNVTRFMRFEDEVGDFLYPGFYACGFAKEYLTLALQYQYLYPIGKNMDVHVTPIIDIN